MTQRDDFEARLVERAQRDPEFRARLLADPRTAVAEALSVEIPTGVTIRVIEEQPAEAVLVLPAAAAADGTIADAELVEVAGGSGGGSWCCNPSWVWNCPR